MSNVHITNSLKVTPIFNYIQEQAELAGLYIHYEKAKETVQLFLNRQTFEKGEKYIGAIQYEGSNDYANKEPHLVSWRFKRSNLLPELKTDLEEITNFRKDKNIGPVINPEAESIAFKFEHLDKEVEKIVNRIVKILQKYS